MIKIIDFNYDVRLALQKAKETDNPIEAFSRSVFSILNLGEDTKDVIKINMRGISWWRNANLSGKRPWLVLKLSDVNEEVFDVLYSLRLEEGKEPEISDYAKEWIKKQEERAKREKREKNWF